MHKGKAYLHCLPRQQAERIWWDKLTAIGYFSGLPVQQVSAGEALGRVTAQCVYARQSVPHYNSSAMDGIAVKAQDTFGAGETAPRKLVVLKSDEPFADAGCYIVDTGDVMPAGTNAVIMVEDVHFSEGYATITAAAAPWQHVRVIGEDIVTNEMVLLEHHVITPADIAALLAAGLDSVEVVAKPKVTVIPTGSELVATHRELKPGTILDVNSHMLCAAVTTWGGVPNRHAIVCDDYQQIKEAIVDSLQVSDMVITNAGTSAGTEDFTADILVELGEVLVHGVAIKPGKPVVLAICQGKPVIGLPGYSVSAMLTAELFVRNVLFARQKLPRPQVETVAAAVSRQVYSHIGVEEYVRVSLGEVQGKTVAAPLGRGAGLISSLTKAQGTLVINETKDGLAAGTVTPISLFGKCSVGNNILSVGSHDLALEILGVFLGRQANLALSCANVGSMGGIMAIRNNEAHIAGIHMLDEGSGEFNVPFVKRYLTNNGSWCLVHLAMRDQGLMVLPGNPKGIQSLRDLVRPDVEYVNRQRGAGTRMLLDYQLRQLELEPGNIAGYDKEVSTHMAVAATIAGGAADTGMGIRAAATALGLDFIPVAQEQYDLILNFSPEDERLALIIGILQSPEFRQQVEALGGYDLSKAGERVAF
ncbi:molybdopterin biosynthesis protein [Sporomusa acidovorans]|uniref:Molybdopterin molybdenumtransferase n=1 Tax=Sporomusa acidovorans (strain ATCC 49682 / DSM 3132 / Mol) TaxID=1123286 RepID=A0ABZ3IY19_SPOA4|nr:molybdopterin biosynthesis protein [Sporomusa acidovorans]OZC23340.1 molybdopterin molybdenumtransferase [Sporomusa acidovorans DSM 3132]SDE42329.1 molybdopterin molybdochelatase [Sporomusa acidovorans]